MAKYARREYITVKEFSKTIGIDEIFINDLMEGKLSSYVVIEGETKKISPKALEVLLKADNSEENKQAPATLDEDAKTGDATNTNPYSSHGSESNEFDSSKYEQNDNRKAGA